MTTTEEQFVSDNSETENTTSEIVSEPETQTVEAVPKAVQDIPDKFKNKDGSTNVSALVKSYKALEPLLNEKANWTKEKASLTAQLSNLQALNPKFEISNQTLQLYEDVLDKSKDGEQAKKLIEMLKTNPSKETLKELEALYPADEIRSIFVKSCEMENLVKQELQQHLFNSEMQSVQEFLTDVVEKNFEALQNPITAEIFNETFLRFGAGLDSEWFFNKLQQLKESFYMDFQKEQNIKNESNTALSTAAKMNPEKSISGIPLSKRNALDLSPQELDRMLDDFYSKH